MEYRTTLPGVVWEGISKGGTGPAKERHGTRMSQEKDQQVHAWGSEWVWLVPERERRSRGPGVSREGHVGTKKVISVPKPEKTKHRYSKSVRKYRDIICFI